ncbi:MAG: hypothetical protein IJU75_07745 [Clostridia bacterium]|nr:hypothetical protein [Clostridia bacterium]
MDKENKVIGDEKATENVRLCPDGVYRWTYEFDMLKNPTILFTVWKVLGVSCGILVLFWLVIGLIDGSIRSAGFFIGMGKTVLFVLAVMLVLGAVSYLILAAVYGRKYQVLFELTDGYVRHIQMPRQYGRAEAIGLLTALSGVVSGRPGVAGIGMNSARSVMETRLGTVTSIKSKRKRNTVFLNSGLERNQVYASDADFDFVENFLRTRCAGAKCISR